MKWPCATDSYPRTFLSKPFCLKDSSHRNEPIANQYSDRPHPFASYSVTRINPLYIDERKVDSRYAYDTIDDEECAAQSCRTDYLHSAPLCDDSIAVVKRDPDFVRGILVSVRLGRCQQRGHGLTPIPEGKVDSIPRPVWPNDDSTCRAHSASDQPPSKRERRDRHRRRCQRQSSCGHDCGRIRNGRAPIAAEYRPDAVGPSPFADAGSTAALLPPALAHILRELSHSINNAMENADRVEIPPDAVLRSLRAKINSCLETISAKEAAAYAADTVADLYERGSGDSGCVVGDRSAVATLSRAFSFVNAFHEDGPRRRNGDGNVDSDGDGDGDEDDDDDVERGRLMLLKRLGRFPPPGPSNCRTSGDASRERPQRSSCGSALGGGSGSSSSGASTSGFSDLTHTPASSNSSASDSPPACRSAEGGRGATGATALLVAATDDLYQQRRSESSSSGVSGEGSAGSGGVELTLKSGCNDVELVGSPSFASSFPYYAIPNQRTASDDVPSRSGSTYDVVAKGIACLAEVTSVRSKTDTLLSSYPGHRCPDFTLDVQQAEKVMKKIQERKKERCWCRLVTSFVGFVFLLFSVMFFSMMFTRGDKMFGPL